MSASSTFYSVINEDGGFSVLARITALTASGDEVAPGEGYCIERADVSTITCKVFDLGTNRNNTTGTEISPGPVIDPDDVILDILSLVGWSVDAYGYNFIHHVSSTYPSSPNTYYLVEYLITLTDATKLWIKVKVKTNPVQTS